MLGFWTFKYLLFNHEIIFNLLQSETDRFFFKVEGNLFIFTACAFNYIPWAPLTICVYGNYKQSCSSAKLRKFSELYAELLS